MYIVGCYLKKYESNYMRFHRHDVFREIAAAIDIQ
mgnify:CR=1 FL=1